MEMTQENLQAFRAEFAKKVLFLCGALGVEPRDFEFSARLFRGQLLVTAELDGDAAHTSSRDVGSIPSGFLQHIRASCKDEVEMTFQRLGLEREATA
jgi:hypothetical protein